jgi:PAS domain S-box-containing protein
MRWVTTFASIYTTGLVGFALPSFGAHFPLPLLPGGIAVAAIYRWGKRMWAPIFAAGAAIQLTMGRPLLAAGAAGAGLAVGALLSNWLLDKSGFEPSFGRAKDVPIFIFATTMGMTIAPTIGMAGFALAGVPFGVPALVQWLRGWSNTVLGVLLVGPALIASISQGLARFTERWVEGVFWSIGVAICCVVIALAPGPVGRAIVVMFALLLIVVAAIRFGLVVSTLATLAVLSTAALSFAFGFGMFGQFDELPGRLTIFSFTATLVAVSLIITALLAERDAAAREGLGAERRYARIFNDSPQAMWVHDPVTQQFLLVNEAAHRQYGWTPDEFLTMKVAALAPPGEPRILPTQKNSAAPSLANAAPFETRHATRDGRNLEVEVWMRSIDLGGRPAELVFALDVSDRRALGKALIDALAAEQQRIASEIHDGLGQELTGLALSLRALTTRAERSLQPLATDLDDLAKLATRCIEGSKRIVQGLSPLSDAGGSLEKALQGLARRASMSGTPVRFQSRQTAPLVVPTEALDHIYRIAQEAVQNALKHASASAIDIELWTDNSRIGLSIMDDGRGLPSGRSVHQGLGMRTMHFRASAIGGVLAIEPLGNGGTAVRCVAPLPDTAPVSG